MLLFMAANWKIVLDTFYNVCNNRTILVITIIIVVIMRMIIMSILTGRIY